jgi:hypothetical protein
MKQLSPLKLEKMYLEENLQHCQGIVKSELEIEPYIFADPLEAACL